jgi:hypothetical protein
MSSIDPENLPSFQMPEDLLDKLYEFTGGSNDNSKGFLLVHTDQSGSPMIFCKSGSQIVEMGIRKALEQYLIGIENVDKPFDINDDQE